ncbi:MAG: hypothetical protein ACHQM6_09150, partial [Candidatus Kapaibacterium sp.]
DLYRTTRSDHDSTIRPTGVNPIVKLGSWSIWDFRQDSIIEHDTLILKNNSKFVVNTFKGFRFTRKNSQPNKIPHSFLDYGDDNGDGILSGNEGLFNGVKYYYFLLATDEFDSVNDVGPLTTAIVNQKNFAVGIPCRPVFPDIPNTIAGDSSCLSGAIGSANGAVPSSGTKVTLQVIDTGKFVQLYTNDTITVSFQPRWTEFIHRVINQSPMSMFVDVADTRQGKELTYDRLYNPSASPVRTPYSFADGIFEQIIGQQKCDSTVSGRFTTNNTTFAPFETVDQAFAVLVDYQYHQLCDPYRLHSITFGSNVGSSSIVGITGRTSRAPQGLQNVNLADIPDSLTIPSYQGGLGEASYEVSFGPLVPWKEDQFDTATGKVITGVSQIKDPNSSTVFSPMAMKVTVKATSHCDQQLTVIRPGNRNDVVVEGDYQYYNHTILQNGNIFPDYSQPDTMVVPLAGKFVMDGFHYAESADNDPSTATFIAETSGEYYFPYSSQNQNNNQFLATIHRLRLGGAELTLNYPGISNQGTTTGDTATYSGHAANDFQPGDKFTVSFTGLMKGLPFPGAQFVIYTSKDKKFNFSDNSLYQESKILDQVQVVPNPYIVEHLGQTSTDNSKLFFTRLPPRATIEIYNLNGELIKTLEHKGVVLAQNGSDSLSRDGSILLADRYNVEEWNLLSEGRQRVGSQVFIARVIAKDPQNDAVVLGEMTTKFAVVLGGYRLVH